jgi:hypothetical protein
MTMGLWTSAKARAGEWYQERRSWELNEEARAEVRKARALIRSRQEADLSIPDQEILVAAEAELTHAERLLDSSRHRRAPIGSHVNSMRMHVDSARLLWMRSFVSDPKAMQPYVAGLREFVRKHLSQSDERRDKIEQVKFLKTANDLIDLLEAVEAAHAVDLRERLRLASFVRTVWCVALLLLLLVLAVGCLTTKWSDAVPLCFTPLSPVPDSHSQAANYSVVCPLESHMAKGLPTTAELAEGSTRGDYWVLELTGFVAAGIASAFALRKIRGTATPYKVHLALTALKLSTGALTAVGGLTLMRGQFVPGLSALDSSAQIIAWAFIFGYSQELFTQFVDKQGESVLGNVRGPGSSTPTPNGRRSHETSQTATTPEGA